MGNKSLYLEMVIWIAVALLNSYEFNSKSVIIWMATLVIILKSVLLLNEGDIESG